MRIGFDLDGVLADSNSLPWIIARENVDALELYCKELKPGLNPALLMHESDVGFIITARHTIDRTVTKRWCGKHFPMLSLFFVTVPKWHSKNDWDSWYDSLAKAKARCINELRLDVYIEDVPQTVIRLRELCPHCRIIQYGGRLE